ncbi:DUF2141 domain-containing protein [Hymenobacter gummosus]|uniref:DUF2141 domain-containing protein n=1 Tax=Hymenobacter gummosus TaxID=1776032 RepID=A0A3S0HRX7_9BACT|nr:DUF2141 domain-containing protein [Hymenobacter gummosus]RTQ53731.1 DUF2141 domain-containing protein [Hymenobacter gummosus]
MKLLLLLLGAALCMGAEYIDKTATSRVANAPLTITVTGIKPNHGKVLVAVLDRNEFVDAGSKVPKYYRLLDGKTMEERAVFENLPYGEYAIGCYQDVNGNLLLDKNLAGIPVEDFAFSNNPSAKWKKPTYDQSKIAYSNSHHYFPIVIKPWIKYWNE